MKRIWVLLVFCLGILGLSGCQAATTTEPPADYLLFEYNRYEEVSEGIFQYGEDMIFITEESDSTILRASFLEGTVTVDDDYGVIWVEYPDSCLQQYENSGSGIYLTIDTTNPAHQHQNIRHKELAQVQIHSYEPVPEGPDPWPAGRIWGIVMAGAGTIIFGLFLFIPGSVEKLIILSNRLIPLWEEPAQPTEWHITRQYLGFLVAFLACLFLVFYSLFGV